MAKKKLQPFTVDDASDTFTPTVKHYVSDDSADENKAVPEKKPVQSGASKEKKPKPEMVSKKETRPSAQKQKSAQKTPQKQKSPKPKAKPESTVQEMVSNILTPEQIQALKTEKAPVVKAVESITETFVPDETGKLKKPVLKGQVNEETAMETMVQLVGFRLEGQDFGLDILKVREIIRVPDITAVPEVPDFMEGVINLRGKVIPVVNLRRRLGLKDKDFDKNTRIVIADLEGKLVGFIVDIVAEVMRIAASAIDPPPQIVAGIKAEYLHGIGKTEEALIILLNLNKLITT